MSSHENCHMHETEVRRITKMEQLLAEIETRQDAHRDALAETSDGVSDLRSRVGEVQLDVKEIKISLLGDMMNHMGVITRLHEVEKSHAAMWTKIDELALLLAGGSAAKGPCVLERLRPLEALADRAGRLMWIVITAAVGQTAALIFAAITYYLTKG